MNNFSQRYLNWYNKNLKAMKKLTILNVVLWSWLMLSLAMNGNFEVLGIVVWLWGLSLVDFAVHLNKKEE